MPVTIKDIADIVGVSRGTVDRALHDRGRIDPEVARRIKKTARELGFEPSRAGRALALAKNPVKLGVVIHLTKTIFMQQVIGGIEQARAELEALGAEVRVHKIPGFDAAKEIELIDDLLEWGAQGIAISPADEPVLRNKIDAVVGKKGVPVITFNTDIPGSKRACFVGQDALRGGATAAGLMRLLCGGTGKVAVITGYLTSHAHNQRVEGFTRELQQSAPDMLVTGVQMCYDEDTVSRRVAEQSLAAYPDLMGIFVAAGGQKGVYEALRQAKVGHKVNLVVYDLLPATLSGLDDGTVDFVIDQNASAQGSQPLRMLFEHLFNKTPITEELYNTGIVIKCRHNL